MKPNIYQIDYWIAKGFNNEESIDLVNKWKKETSCRCKEFWMKKGYNEQDSIEMVKTYQKKSNSKRTTESYKEMLNPYQKEYWIKKGITDEKEIDDKINEQKIKSNPYLTMDDEQYTSMMNNRKKTYYSKSSDEIKKINNKRGRTKLQLIEEYGEYEANEMTKNRGKNKKFQRRYSKISELFFDKLQDYIKDKNMFYGKNEKWIRVQNNKGFFVDLIVENENKIIEFNGDFFHANPSKYQKDDIIKISENEQYRAYELWNKDEMKMNMLKESNYDVYVVWENDIKNNFDEEIEKCLTFLKNK